jgi:hypothetical protein
LGLVLINFQKKGLAANSEHGCATLLTNRFLGGFAVFHGDTLNILAASFGTALDTVEVCHRFFSPPLHKTKKLLFFQAGKKSSLP